ncbi:MAG: hypothetical protein HC829_03470 [Bacteroidales bacterium]|nr:hypothetical protein [Candidatus Methylacidiphilales bacterium]NJO54009.1 hypothetical protein [Bacteroidales bacterium]
MYRPSDLPGVLAEIADVAGVEAAFKLAEKYGGTRRSFPAQMPNGPHWLSDCVGVEAAKKICASFRCVSAKGRGSGIYLLIPRGPTGPISEARQNLEQALAEGASAAEAARRAGMTERAAYRARARLKHQKRYP